MDEKRLVTRRVAIKDMGKAGLALMVFGAACSTETGTGTTTTGPGTVTTNTAGTTTTAQESTTTSTTPRGLVATDWERVNLGFVSAYILYRANEAALVDTGQSGAEGDIEAALSRVGLGWDAVTSVIVTHKHPDHAGSIDAVAGLASNANFYVGSGDIAAIGEIPGSDGIQGPVPVGDNDSVFGLDIIETPGHTPGHIAVLDRVAGVLVAGDAMNTIGGTLNPADPAFTENPSLADSSIKKLAGLGFEVLLVGHGDPIESGASQAVADLAAGIPG